VGKNVICQIRGALLAEVPVVFLAEEVHGAIVTNPVARSGTIGRCESRRNRGIRNHVWVTSCNICEDTIDGAYIDLSSGHHGKKHHMDSIAREQRDGFINNGLVCGFSIFFDEGEVPTSEQHDCQIRIEF
jgi:hypothetical protein